MPESGVTDRRAGSRATTVAHPQPRATVAGALTAEPRQVRRRASRRRNGGGPRRDTGSHSFW